MKPKIRLIVARELGFCFGVRRSIDIALSVRNESDGNVTALNELVHSRSVSESLSSAGIGQASDIRDVPPGKLIISAHGVPRQTLEQAYSRNLDVIDTTCPLVAKVHVLVQELIGDGYHIIVFGDPNHDEIRGIIGHGDSRKMTVIKEASHLPEAIPDRCALIPQTTQNLEEFEMVCEVIKHRLPSIRIHNTICKPTRKRQQAAIETALQCELVYVIGSKTSANSRRLAEITERICGRSILIDNADQVSAEHFEGGNTIGLTAGASSPDSLIVEVIEKICTLFDVDLVASQPEFARIADETGKQ